MASFPLDPDELRRIIALFDRYNLIELEVRDQGVRVRLSAAVRTVKTAGRDEADADDVETGPGIRPARTSADREPTPGEKGWVAIEAPITGTFYRASAPDDPDLVEANGPVEEDQVIGIIEAMKTFNLIRSEVSGTVMDVPVANGQMVRAGQVLAWVLPHTQMARE